MDTDVQYYYQALVDAIKLLDSSKVRKALDQNVELPPIENVFHYLCTCKQQTSCAAGCVDSDSIEVIIYMLIDYGFDIDAIDEKGNTCLLYAVQNSDVHLCEVLLQCGANMWANTQFNISVLDYVIEKSTESIQNVFNKYYPGVWKAIVWQDIDQVRKLINLWCRTDLYKGDMSLKNLALNTGDEEIISLILGIFETMKLIYHIRARNIKAVSELLAKKQHKIRLNLRKISDHGAPILYYLIKSCDVEVIELFMKCGCPLYTIMQDDNGFDMPVLFSALKSDTPLNVIEALLPQGQPHQEEMLFRILYKGRTVLEVALEEKVTKYVFSLLIEKGGPLLLCERNPVNKTVRDVAVSMNATKYVDVIDKCVMSWIMSPQKYIGRRQKLALYGWDLNPIKEQFPNERSIEDYICYAENLQKGISRISVAVEEGDIEKYFLFKALLSEFESQENFLWNAKVVGDGIPLLHKAVLHNRPEVVSDILLAKPINQSIDNLFDQNRRTALHYAYGSSGMKEIRSLLMSYGCSEHILDKVNKEPLDFRDRQDTPAMMELFNRLKSKNYSQPECDPWSVREKPHEFSCFKTSELLSHAEDGAESEDEQSRSFCSLS